MQLKKKCKRLAKICIVFTAMLCLVFNRNSIFEKDASNVAIVKQEIIRILYENKVFLIDIDILTQIYRLKSLKSNNYDINFYQLSTATFGIYSENIFAFKNEVIFFFWFFVTINSTLNLMHSFILYSVLIVFIFKKDFH